MPLYSNILSTNHDDGPPGTSATAATRDQEKPLQKLTPSASLRLLQDHLLSKKRAKQAHLGPNKLIKASERPLNEQSNRQSENDLRPEEEYDPMTPNSYEILLLEHTRAEEQRLAARKSGNRIDLSILDALDRFDDNDCSPDLKERSSRGIAIAPPPTLQSVADGSTQEAVGTPKATVQASQTPSDRLDGRSAAAKIMAKMGYKSGQGLGKDKQGISAPLEVESCGTGVGHIVKKQHQQAQQETAFPELQRTPVDVSSSRVLLLQNMVGPGEVDDDLEAETKEECTKYGEVIKCLIYEIPNKQVADDEAVRIFVEFKEVESTKRAISDLNGRYFGGRVVRATFYEENKFNRYELGP